MKANAATVPLLDHQGKVRGEIVITCLPRTTHNDIAALVVRGSVHHPSMTPGNVGGGAVSVMPWDIPRVSIPPILIAADAGEPKWQVVEVERSAELLETVQLLEATEYLYRVRITTGARVVTTDKPDIFDANNAAGFEGRLRTGLHTGLLRVLVSADGTEIGAASFEVRSRKLDYVQHYRWMLQDIAEVLAELVMERFAPTAQRFEVDASRDARTLYQRFAFLNALIDSERFEIAMRQILSRPHRVWREELAERRPNQGVPTSRDVARQIARRTDRIPCATIAGLSSLPITISVGRHEETRDTPENRFVKFALIEWRNLALSVARALEAVDERTAPVSRGIAEAYGLTERLDLLLSHDLFRRVGNVDFVPFGSQVLQKRAGYRDLFRFYLQAESAAALAWEGGEDVYGAGQRNVAALYEYWTFLQLAKVVAGICNEQIDPRDLLVLSADGLGISLRRGTTTAIRGRVRRLGRELALDLRFNQSFAASEKYASWTVPLRPDISLCISLEHGDTVWVHFDAKYRIEHLREIFTGDTDKIEPEPDEREPRAKRSDIIKMHAYHDAIRRSVGAYVLYPGAENEQCFEYHELLPGVGAFALGPTATGAADGSAAIGQFLDEVLTHVASQFTQHERGRFWSRTIFDPKKVHGEVGESLQFLDRPPVDASVLIVELGSEGEYDNLRDGKRLTLRVTLGGPVPTSALGAQYAILLGSTIDTCEVRAIVGLPLLRTVDDVSATLEMSLTDALPLTDGLVAERARNLWAAPWIVTTWQELAGRSS